MKLEIFKKIKVVKMYKRGITILSREDLVMKKGLKKFIKEKCTAADHGDGAGVKRHISILVSYPNIVDISLQIISFLARTLNETLEMSWLVRINRQSTIS